MLSLDVLVYTMPSLVTCLISPSYMLSLGIRHDILDSYNYHDNGNDDLASCLHLDIFQYKPYS